MISTDSADALRAIAAEHGSPLLLVDCEVIRRQYRALAAALPGVDLHYALKPLPRCDSGQGARPRRRLVRPRDRRRSRSGARRRRSGGALHSHAPDQARLGHPPCARLRRDHLRRRQSGRVAASSRPIAGACNCWSGLRSGAARRSSTCRASSAASPKLRSVWSSRRVQPGCAFPDSRSTSARRSLVPTVRCARSTTSGRLIAEARRRSLGPIEVLDIGGGFPIDYLEPAPAIGEFCRPIRAALAKLPAGLRIIAEPGRFICGPAGLACARSLAGRGATALVVLPRRRPLRHLQRPDLRSLALPGRAACRARASAVSLRAVGADLRQHRRRCGGLADAGTRGRRTARHAPDRRVHDRDRDRFQFFPARAVVPVNVEPAVRLNRAATAAAGG